ncbi:MAG: methylated-DNA--[protein]-cysteine S-methyltransferase [Chitinispirillia bacterium]|nr:methylated-DNA--[protein]-cysteine S-methyltransferase [Chitinispirillia bacterium]
MVTEKFGVVEYADTIKSPAGTLTVSSDGENITGLWIEGQKYFGLGLGSGAVEGDIPLFRDVRKWLDIYFSGREPGFAVPLMPYGSEFQKAVWGILTEIPYGQTVTYGDIARQYSINNKGKHTSPRAVGGAVGRNPVSILIPCHRVVGWDGSLTGYAGGVSKKLLLLRIEGARLNRAL